VTRTSIDERESIYARTVLPLIRVMRRCAIAFSRGDHLEHELAVTEMGRYIGQVLAVCNLLGRRRTMIVARATVGRAAQFATTLPSGLIPATEFEEAVSDILEREPALAEGWAAVSELYTTQHGFALAKSADVEITRRVQAVVAQTIREGRAPGAAAEEIAGLGGWTRAYAETVFRTNAATAYTAGTFEQARDPDIAAVMTAFEYLAARDADTRENHAALHGLIAATDDPLWNTYAPPCGYNCRCDLRLVSKYELEEMGLIGPAGQVLRRIPPNFSAGGPDPGFRTGNPSQRFAA
jgi:SPP1 gp7 family putative phage head morphogenesis protein